MSRRRFNSLVLTVALIWPLAALAAPGDADKTFSRDGRVKTSVANQFDHAWAVARQSNGKIILGGWGAFAAKRHDFVLLRYTKRGNVDKSFGGGDGVARLHLRAVSTEEWTALHVLPNDKILALGRTGNGSDDDYDLVLARYKPDGRLDRSFSGDGKVVKSFGSGTHQFNDLVVFPNRDIGVVGAKSTGIALDLLAARFSADGNFLGRRVDDLGAQDYFSAATLQNGKLVGVGSSGGDFVIFRYTHSGSPDSTFGASGGYTEVDLGGSDQGKDLVRLPNGKFVVAGETGAGGPSIALAIFKADGLLDTASWGGGTFTQPMGGMPFVTSIVRQPRDRFAILGSLYDSGGNYDFMAVRYHNDAIMDTTFGDFGIKLLSVGGTYDQAQDGLVQPDGRLVLAGQAGGCCRYHFAAVRLKGDVFTTLRISGAQEVVAKGRQFPALPGEELVVTLFKKQAGTFQPIATKKPTLKGRADRDGDGFAESAYRAGFDRPASGQCRVRARWPGGRGYPSSQAVEDFAC